MAFARSTFSRSARQVICKLQAQQRRLTHTTPLRYLVGVDGTEFGFAALRRAFECSQQGDEVIALHFPQSIERIEAEVEYILYISHIYHSRVIRIIYTNVHIQNKA